MIVDLSNKNNGAGGNVSNMVDISSSNDAEEVQAKMLYNLISMVDEVNNKPTSEPYDDSELSNRVTTLENKPEPAPYDDSTINSRVSSLEATIGTIDAELSNILGE